MPQKDWKKLWNEAKKETNEQLAGKISSITSMKDEEILRVLEESSAEKEELIKLMEVVDDATKDNQEKANALQNINNATSMLISLSKKVL